MAVNAGDPFAHRKGLDLAEACGADANAYLRAVNGGDPFAHRRGLELAERILSRVPVKASSA